MSQPPPSISSVRDAIEQSVSAEECSPEVTRRLIRGEPRTGVLPGEASHAALEPAIPGQSPPTHTATSDGDEHLPDPLPSRGTRPAGATIITGGIRTLEQVIKRLEQSEPDRYSPMPARVELAIALCGTVSKAHDDGLVLRDIKPAHISIGLLGEIALLDKGSAVRLGDVPAQQAPVGTPAYMSPEQSRGEAVDQRSDQYALGVTLYRLFCQCYPTWDIDPEVFWAKKRAGTLNPVPASVHATVPAPLLAICLQAMQADPARRYASVAQLAEDLRAYADARPVTAFPEHLLGRASRLWMRHGNVVLGAGIAAGITACAAAWIAMSSLGRTTAELRTRSEAAIAQVRAVADGAVDRSAALRRQLDDLEAGQGWRQIVDADLTQPLPAEIEVVQVNETHRVETNPVDATIQIAGVGLGILPAAHRTFLRWRRGLVEESRIDVDVECNPATGWNIDLSVAGDPLNGYRLRLAGRDYLCLETIASGYMEMLQRISPEPLQKSNRLRLTLEHSGGHVLVSIDGRPAISYLDPFPPRGELHRAVAIGRFFESGDTIIRRMRIWTRKDARLVSVLEPGLALMRAGRGDDAMAWFDKVHAEQESPQLSSEAEFLAAAAQPDPAARRTRLERLASIPGHRFAVRALDLLAQDALAGQRWNDAIAAHKRRQTLDNRPDLDVRLADRLLGQLHRIGRPGWHGILASIAQLPLTTLNINKYALSDVSAIADMQVAELELAGNHLTSLAALAGMPLRVLSVEDNAITDLAPLSGKRLTTLNIAYNPIADLQPLAGIGLENLAASHTAITDLKPLGRARLQKLDIQGCKITDLAALAGQPLQELTIPDTPIADLGGPDLSQLRRLTASRSAITTLAPLAKATKLDRLHLAETAVADASPLRGLPLSDLDISDTAITDLSFVAGMPLRRLTANGTRISSLAALSKLELNILSLSRTPITSLQGLPTARLTELHLGNCKLERLDELRGLSLMSLSLPSGPFTPADLAILSTVSTRNLGIDAGNAAHWQAAAAMPNASRINGLPRSLAMRCQEACLAIAAGGNPDLTSLAMHADDMQVVILPMRVQVERIPAVLAQVGGRIPTLDTDRRRSAVIRILAEMGMLNDRVVVDVRVEQDGTMRWPAGSLLAERLTLREVRAADRGMRIGFNLRDGYGIITPGQLTSVILSR
jgi:Leucine-rich repeat (LRR) protein